MGIYDRDYYQEQQQPGFVLRKPATAVGWIIVINVAIFILDAIVGPYGKGDIAHTLALNTGVLAKPWLWWKFITCGFAHASYPAYGHVLWNMLGLFFLGRTVEEKYGRTEFTWFYMLSIVFGSVLWFVLNIAQGLPSDYFLLGASGAVTAVVILYVLNFPHRTLLFMMVIPVPGWLVGVLLIVSNILGWTGGDPGGPKVAYGVHLAGAGFAAAYFYLQWNISRVVAPWIPQGWFKNRPRLRVHDPGDDYGGGYSDSYGDSGGRPIQEDYTPPKPSRAELRRQAKAQRHEEEVDRILAKIQASGVDSLSPKERRTMEAESRRLRERKRGG